MKNKEYLIRFIFLFVSLLLLGGIIFLIYNFQTEKSSDSTTVGVVMIGQPDDKGWNESHHDGILNACNSHSCRMLCQTSVPEEEEPLMDAVSELAKNGCSVIFLTSYGYGNFADSITKAYPNIAFYSISGDCPAKNFMSYFARMYQVRYLSGIVAGAATKSNKLGFVTAMLIPETVRSINAYALGARKANPSAEVLVKVTGSWDDRKNEEAATKMLVEKGADVITFHEDKPHALEVANEIGLFTTGYDYVSEKYSEKFLTASLFNWDMLYSRVLSDYLSGRANFSNDYWLGLSEGAVSLYPYSKYVTEETKKLVSEEEKRIMTWRDVFSGEIYDNTGRLRCHKNERISDDTLFNNIDWFVEGVEVYE